MFWLDERQHCSQPSCTGALSMAYEQRPGDIAIFNVKEKRNERGPDMTGTYVGPDGVKYEVSLWRKSETMLAGSIKPARERTGGGGGSDYQPREETRQRASVGDSAPFDDSEVPF